jgi:rhamnosyltransferase subunit B
VLAAGKFYEYSAKAAVRLGIRAVLLIGSDQRNRPPQTLADTICVAEYAPYSALFSRAALVVHQGGVGTVAQCLRAGTPMLIMPYSHDQPDNARRMQRLKVGRTIQRENYTPQRVARKLKQMLGDQTLALRAEQVAEQLKNEAGVRSACDALEELYRSTRKF